MEAAIRRRRRILLLLAAAGIGGYATYKVYKSSFVTRKRRRVAALIESLVQMIEVFAMGIDSTSLIAGDLRDFLLSDDDEVPRSIKQTLKIAKCRELQDAVTVFSSCISRGMVRSVVDRNGGGVGMDEFSSSRRRNGPLNHDKGDNFGRACDRSSGKLQGGESSMDCSSFKQDDRIPERLLQKLFSDPGKGFASVVLGSVARNTVMSILEGLQSQQSRSRSSEWELRGLAPDVVYSSAGQRSLPFEVSDALLEVCSSSRGRSFIASCIQAFVGTAVTVYLEKTKDVNMYEEIVAGVTKPSHQAAVKDLLSSVCSSAVETFVRTSHEVLTSATGSGDAAQDDHLKDEVVEELVKTVDRFKAAASGSSDHRQSSEAAGGLQGSTNMIVVTSSRESSRINVLPNWLDGISRTLAVPSNRKLLIDVAGTVTSEAIHSFFEVFLGVLSPYLRGNLQVRGIRGRDRDKRTHSVNGNGNGDAETENHDREIFKVGQLSKVSAAFSTVYSDLVGKVLVVFTVCLALAMHVLSGVPDLRG